MSLVTKSEKRNREYVRAFDHDEARRLHVEEELSYSEIAERMGVSHQAVRRVIDPQVRARMDEHAKTWMRENREPCKGCGVPIYSHGQQERSGLCRACYAASMTAPDERPTELRCTHCGEWKPDEDYGRERRQTRRGHRAWCRDCETAARRRHRAEHRDRERAVDNERKRKGKTVSRYLVMKQNGDGGWHEFAEVEAVSKEQAIEKAADSEGTYIAATKGQLTPRRVGTVTRLGIVKDDD